MRLVGVVGGSTCTDEERVAAETVGRLLAEAGVAVVCGGRSGVMEAVCRGAQAAGGITVGILPGSDCADANPFVTVAIPTGLGEARNVIVATAADAVIAVGGEYGTLSEIAFALKGGKRVLGLGTWAIPGVAVCATPEEAVRGALSTDF